MNKFKKSKQSDNETDELVPDLPIEGDVSSEDLEFDTDDSKTEIYNRDSLLSKLKGAFQPKPSHDVDDELPAMPIHSAEETGTLSKIVVKTKSFIKKQKNNKNMPNIPAPKSLSKVNWNELHNEIFKDTFLNKFHYFFIIALVVLVSYHSGKIGGLVLTGPANFKMKGKVTSLNIDDSKEILIGQVKQLSDANLFNTILNKSTGEEAVKEIVINKDIICEAGTRNTKLPIKLVNTVVLQDSVKSIASVQIRSADLQEVRERENIDNLARVDKIDRLSVIIRNLKDGSCETVMNNFEKNDQPKAISVLSPSASRTFKATKKKKVAGVTSDKNNFKLKKAFIQDKMKDLSSLLTQARGIPIRNPDGTMSFKIVEIEPGGVFATLGIENNDVITHINGDAIKNLNEVMSLFGKISTLDKLNLTISRGGQSTPFNYEME